MNVVDSSGWLEYLAGGPNAAFFAPALQATDELVVPVVCIYEVFRRVLAQRGEEAALQAAGLMSQGQVADMTRDLALDAAVLSGNLKLAMADSFILATARAHEATLWTQDADFAGLDGVAYVAKVVGE